MWYDEQDKSQNVWESYMTILYVCLIICVIAVLVCLVSIWHASTHFHKVYYRLSSEKISKPVKFVLLTDLHDKEYGVENNNLIQAIVDENPNAVLIAGDMMTARPQNKGGYREVALQLMQKLSERYPVYYGLGNHEKKMDWNRKCFGDQYEPFMEQLKHSGVKVLQDDFTEMEESHVRIYGLDLESEYYKRTGPKTMEDGYMAQKFGIEHEAYYRILLAHNPAYFEQYAKWNPDLVLSGHVHGGLVRLPLLGGVISPSLKIFPKYDGGLFHCGKATMILSRGLGFHSIEFRMWNQGELVVIEIEPLKETERSK